MNSPNSIKNCQYLIIFFRIVTTILCTALSLNLIVSNIFSLKIENENSNDYPYKINASCNGSNNINNYNIYGNNDNDNDNVNNDNDDNNVSRMLQHELPCISTFNTLMNDTYGNGCAFDIVANNEAWKTIFYISLCLLTFTAYITGSIGLVYCIFMCGNKYYRRGQGTSTSHPSTKDCRFFLTVCSIAVMFSTVVAITSLTLYLPAPRILKCTPIHSNSTGWDVDPRPQSVVLKELSRPCRGQTEIALADKSEYSAFHNLTKITDQCTNVYFSVVPTAGTSNMAPGILADDSHAGLQLSVPMTVLDTITLSIRANDVSVQFTAIEILVFASFHVMWIVLSMLWCEPLHRKYLQPQQQQEQHQHQHGLHVGLMIQDNEGLQQQQRHRYQDDSREDGYV